MRMEMTGSWELNGKALNQQFIRYAHAYLSASRDQCNRMREKKIDLAWENAVVAILLATHSAELFLKGAILSIKPDQKLPGHDLRELTALFNQLAGESIPHFDNPFESELPEIDEATLKELRESEVPQSILYRYPADRYGIEWPGTYALDLLGFSQILRYLEESYAAIEARI
jgi:hypothetical protein